jgi:hypothetical protein
MDDVLAALVSFERRLDSIADQARETREQAQHTLDRLNRLRRDLERFREDVLAASDTMELPPGPAGPGR